MTDGVIKVFHEVIICKTCDQVIFISYGLKICRKFTGEHPCRSTISIKLQSNFIVWHRVVVVITTAQFQPSRNSGSAQVRTCSQHVRDSRWWGSLTMAPAGNKAKGLSLVNHTTKKFIIIDHHHHHHWITLRHGCSPVNLLLRIFKHLFLKKPMDGCRDI